ncbi:MAG TPA: VWA domain-containing protein [Pyrinomonadaceae bacterium]|nr:VWA domain-containing protein [Pyrinomonadaceae bacterium]
MKRQTSLIAPLLLLSLFAQAFGQTPQTTPAPQTRQPAQQPSPAAQRPAPQEESDEDVVRITSNLVQFDAVVTDKQGRPVTDLRPEDFEVYANGRKQELTNFSYINAGTVAAPAQQPSPRAADKSAPPVPPARLKSGQVRRTVALVVDDLGTSWESTNYVRQALKKFVDQQMQPGDLVAIMRTSAGMGALQQFTSDKQMLYRAIEHIRWYPMGRSGVAAFAPMQAVNSPGMSGRDDGSRDSSDSPFGAGRDATADLDEFREEIFSVGTLGALNFIIRGMQELPGRKSVIMFSDGFPIYDQRDPSKGGRQMGHLPVLDNLRRLVDLANRASVVVYTVDARGLPVLGLTAADNTNGRSFDQVRQELDQRSQNYTDSQAGMGFLADQTGGLFIHDNNDLGGAVRRVLEDQKGYYLIGFRPDESVFERVRGRMHFNNLQVKLKRPGLKVRTRSGFIGLTDEEARPARRTRAEQIVGALTSPFASGDVRVRLTSLFGGYLKGGAFVSSLMHIDLSNVHFTDEPDGWHKAVLDVVAFTFGEDGQVVDHLDRTETFRVRAKAFDAVRRDGLVYTMQVPVRKPGAYQLRVAVRDTATEKLGSASQFIEVPSLKKDRISLSGILMQSGEYSRAHDAPAAGAPADGQPKEPDETLAQGCPALRRFRLGEDIDCYFNIYNPRLDPAGRPRLQTQLRIFRDGQQVYAGQPVPFDPDKQTDMKTLHDGTRMRLGGLAPGEYVLQVVVTDLLAPEKRRTVTQWTDFEVIK